MPFILRYCNDSIVCSETVVPVGRTICTGAGSPCEREFFHNMDAANKRVVSVAGHTTPQRIASVRAQSDDDETSTGSASSTTRGRRRFRRRPPSHQQQQLPQPSLVRCHTFADESTLTMRTRDWLSAGISEVAIRIKDDSSRPMVIVGDQKPCKKADHDDDHSSISSMSSFGEAASDGVLVKEPVVEETVLRKPDPLPDDTTERISRIEGEEGPRIPR